MPQQLTPEQTQQYYATERQKAAPLSPLKWLEQQTAPQPITQPLPEPAQQPTFVAADVTGAPSPPLYEPPAPPDDLSLKIQIEQQRKALEAAHQAELDRINKQLEEARKKEEEFRAKQVGVLEEAKPLTSPFREDIEKAERERLKVEENFFANQALTNELDRLLTESIEMTRKLQAQKVPGLAGLQQSERMINAQQNVQGRIAVVEAVMSARNNQIGTALTFIDRTLGAIQADRQDRLNYLNTLFNFYETTRTEEGVKIFNLTKDQKDIINKQIGLLESDLDRAEKVADTIRNIMLENPQMASESGISLSDTEEQIVKKIADWQYSTEVRTMKNEAETQGLTYLTPEQASMKPAEQIFTQIDSKGVKRQFLIPPATADWQLRDVNGSLYRIDPQTGARELLIAKVGGVETTSMIQYLANQGIPLTVATSAGELTTSALNKVVQVGVPLDIAQHIWTNMQAGNDFETIRQGLRNDGIDAEYLDKFVQALKGTTGIIETTDDEELQKAIEELKKPWWQFWKK